MKRYLLISLALIILVMISCKDNTTSVEETGKISGRVLDYNTNEPITDAYITTDPPSESVLTDNYGYFKIFSVDPGPHKINASKKGYVSSFTSVTVQKGVIVQSIILMKNADSLNLPPGIPNIASPLNNSLVEGNSVNLSWTCTDPDDNALSYTILLGMSPNTIVPVTVPLIQAQYQLNNLSNDGDYYWQIKAEDPSGAFSYSDVYKFSVNVKKGFTLDSLKLYFPFDGNAIDAGAKHYQTSSQNVIYGIDRHGNFNGAAGFDGKTSFISVETQGMLDFNGDFTITFWLKPDVTQSKSYDGHIDILSRMDCTPYQCLVGVNVDHYPEYWVFNNGNVSNYSSPSPLYDNVWQHVGVVVKKESTANSTASIYINGKFAGSNQMNYPLNDDSCSVFIGKRINDLTYFAGYLDDLYIFNRALSVEDLNYLASN